MKGPLCSRSPVENDSQNFVHLTNNLKIKYYYETTTRLPRNVLDNIKYF